ncbi:hypothetical protein KY290_037168 [Solanum tuberosum]|uniref:Uncharacterized protein n=1 Tax=Solanum tuberosum TaxID=4113 RepID=A0ABQ7TVF4_SOLTU|nr:hypothetical protein KY290_037168 [Solanum tuberosum]
MEFSQLTVISGGRRGSCRVKAKFAHILFEVVKSNKIVDIQDLLMKATLDSVFRVSFGVELDSMSGSNEQGKNFIAAFDDANAMTLWRYVDILWKIKRFLNIETEAKKTEQMSTPKVDLSVSESPFSVQMRLLLLLQSHKA